MIAALALMASTFGAYHLEDTVTTHPYPDVVRSEYRIMDGTSPLQRFSITNVRRRDRCLREEPPVVLYSPFLLPGSFYEIADAGDYSQSVAGNLANDGYDVWLVDQRRSGLLPGACEQGNADCSVMATWDYSTLSTDGLLALVFASWYHPGKKPVIGGFSAGANLAMAVANRAPRAISGLFLYEGTFYTEDTSIMGHNAPICQQLEAALDAGQAYDPGAQIYGPLLSLAETDPLGPSPIPGFPPGTTNQLAMLYVFSSPAPENAVAPTAGFTRNLADFATQSFLYTDPQRLFQTGPKFDNYAPLAPMRDLACGLAGFDYQHVDHLDAFRGDVLLFIEGTGFGQAMFDTEALLVNARSFTIDSNQDLGEADPYFHREWQSVFYAPLKQWLDDVVF